MKLSLRMPIAVAALFACSAQAVEIASVASNLADPVPGQDRWLYRYQLDEFPYDAGYGFTVYFDPDLYADLQETPVSPAQWNAITAEPDVNLGDDGLYDAQALLDAPTVAVSFTVSFRWLGAGTPGAQPFEVREPLPSFAVIESGTTVVPEPAALSLGAGAIAALAGMRRTQS